MRPVDLSTRNSSGDEIPEGDGARDRPTDIFMYQKCYSLCVLAHGGESRKDLSGGAVP